MPDDPATEPYGPGGAPPTAADGGPEVEARRRDIVVAGHREDATAARTGLTDPHPSVRAAALGALGRIGTLRLADVLTSLDDPAPAVRRRAAQEAVALRGQGTRRTLPAALVRGLSDPDALVAESACWALGERRVRRAVEPLAEMAGNHPDTRCREAAVAALGAIGDSAGLAAVLGALEDKPTVRRRAVVALAAFDGPGVEEALRRSLEDRDWQVRQSAEILLEE